MDKETMEFLKAMQESITNQINGLKDEVSGLKDEIQSVKQELKEFRAEFNEHKAQTDEKFKEVLNVINNRYEDLKEDIRTITAVQGEFRHDLERLKRKVG